MADGLISRYLNRRLSRPLARGAARRGLTPNQVTALSTAFALTVPLLFAANRPRLAGIAIQAASVADGVDGDLARLTDSATRFGAVLDAVSDRYADAAILAGMTAWSRKHERRPATALIGLGALVGSLMVSYSRARTEAETGKPAEAGFLGYATRDVRLLVAALGSMAGRVHTTLLILALATNFSVLRRLRLLLQDFASDSEPSDATRGR